MLKYNIMSYTSTTPYAFMAQCLTNEPQGQVYFMTDTTTYIASILIASFNNKLRKTILSQMLGRQLNDELEGMWKEAIMC
jgi:hypothetical protein